jgi:hypothetical protein
MPGAPVSIGTAVVVTPGATGAPDTGIVLAVLPPVVTGNGMPFAVAGTICQMVNSLTGVPYPLVVGPLASGGVTVGGRALVRTLDRVPSPPGVLTVLGPPAAPFVLDRWPP